jgi:hypothetical protein
MVKAGEESTPSSAISTEPSPDDDASWASLDEAYEFGVEQVRYGEIVARELGGALAQGRLHCMARSTTTGARKLVADWADQFMLWLGKDGLRVMQRPQPGERHALSVRGWYFYVCRSELGAIWPAKKRTPKIRKRLELAKRQLEKVFGCPPNQISDEISARDMRKRILTVSGHLFSETTLQRASGRRND